MVGKRKMEPDVNIRIPAELARRADAVAKRNRLGLDSRNEVASHALRMFLDEEDHREMLRQVFEAWVAGGRKGPPPSLTEPR